MLRQMVVLTRLSPVNSFPINLNGVFVLYKKSIVTDFPIAIVIQIVDVIEFSGAEGVTPTKIIFFDPRYIVRKCWYKFGCFKLLKDVYAILGSCVV